MRTTISTSAIILSSRPLRERSVLVSLFTKDMGYVRAVADGVLSPQSKLSQALATTSYGTYTLVRGNHEWRIRGGKGEGNAFYELTGDAWRAYRRILLLLQEVLHGEEPAEVLFKEITALYSSLSDPLTPSATASMVAELRIFSLLGVLDATPFPFICEYGMYEGDILRVAVAHQSTVYELIKKGREALGLVV